MSRSAGPFTGAPPTIGLTPTTRSRRATSTSRMPGTARIGPIEITGFDGQITIVSACSERLEHARRGPGRRRRPSKRTARTGDSARSPTNHSCIASSSVRPPSRSTVMRVRTAVVGHRQQLHVELPRARDLARDVGERRTRAEPLRAEQMGREVVVAEPEPGRDVVARRARRASRTSRPRAPSPAPRSTRRRACT